MFAFQFGNVKTQDFIEGRWPSRTTRFHPRFGSTDCLKLRTKSCVARLVLVHLEQCNDWIDNEETGRAVSRQALRHRYRALLLVLAQIGALISVSDARNQTPPSAILPFVPPVWSICNAQRS